MVDLNDLQPLFTSFSVKCKTVRNRIVMPPMVVNRGLTTPEGIDWYRRHAAGGVGIVIVEASEVMRFGSEFTSVNLRPLAQAIQEGEALAIIQLFPGDLGQGVTPERISGMEIRYLVESYRLAAEICSGAGFDGIEPHGAHGFLLNQFFSPVENSRTDEYGGASLEGRMRLGLEIVRTVQPIVEQAGMLLFYRHTPIGPGYGLEDSLIFAQKLLQAGVDILDISPASHHAPGDRSAPFMCWGAPVIAVNELDVLPRAMEVLREKRADLIAVGRQLIADAEWTNKVRQGRYEEIVNCVRCDECFKDLDEGIPVTCKQW